MRNILFFVELFLILILLRIVVYYLIPYLCFKRESEKVFLLHNIYDQVKASYEKKNRSGPVNFKCRNKRFCFFDLRDYLMYALKRLDKAYKYGEDLEDKFYPNVQWLEPIMENLELVQNDLVKCLEEENEYVIEVSFAQHILISKRIRRK